MFLKQLALNVNYVMITSICGQNGNLLNTNVHAYFTNAFIGFFKKTMEVKEALPLYNLHWD